MGRRAFHPFLGAISRVPASSRPPVMPPHRRSATKQTSMIAVHALESGPPRATAPASPQSRACPGPHHKHHHKHPPPQASPPLAPPRPLSLHAQKDAAPIPQRRPPPRARAGVHTTRTRTRHVPSLPPAWAWTTAQAQDTEVKELLAFAHGLDVDGCLQGLVEQEADAGAAACPVAELLPPPSQGPSEKNAGGGPRKKQ